MVRHLIVIVLALAMGVSAIHASGNSITFKIPPVMIPLKIKDQQATIVASAIITLVAQSRGLNTLKLEFTADLSNLQRNMTGLLSSALDKDDRCGDRIDIQNATLTPVDPAALATVQLHYERWVCAKLFGKQEDKRLIGGNAMIQMKLTPAVEENNTELRLVLELGPVEADGSLGELLRSGTLGEVLRDKIQSAILAALKKGTDLSATLPSAVQGYVTIQDAQFKDSGSGRLAAVLDGEGRITNEQLQALSKEIKERIASR